MKKIYLVLFLLINLLSFSQEFEKKFFDTNKNEITEKQFYKLKNYEINHEVFYQNDSLIIGMLVNRKNKGKLDKVKSIKVISFSTLRPKN